MRAYTIHSALEDIAEAYELIPPLDCEQDLTYKRWDALGASVLHQFAEIATDRGVTIVDNPEPYENAAVMSLSLKVGCSINVSRANSTHPVWDVPTNVAFRAAHDVVGHLGAFNTWNIPVSFTWNGELAACAMHALTMRKRARHALFVECIAQTAYAEVHGEFAEQKVTPYFKDYLRPFVHKAYDDFIEDPRTALYHH